MNKQNELKIVRNFDAPVQQVWHAWTDPEHFKKWWGPMGYSCPDCIIDFRVGGKYINSMMDDKGNKIWTTGVYKEIVPTEKIVYTDSFSDESGNIIPSENYGMKGIPLEMIVTVILKDINGKTEMTVIHEGLPEGEHITGANIGWNTSFDKMAESFK